MECFYLTNLKIDVINELVSVLALKNSGNDGITILQHHHRRK